MRTAAFALACSLLPFAALTARAETPPPLPEESLPSVAALPAAYPPGWVLVHDFNFNAIVDGRIAIVDIHSANQPLKGIVRAAQFASLLQSPARHELYTAETFYSRLTTGTRTDVITIWDMATLKPKGEIVLPGGKRQQSVTYTGLFQFTNDEKWALVANFTPAQSVTVVDLEGRQVLGEIDLPGCAHIYPTNQRGFSSLCADGSLISLTLDEKGAVASSKTIANVQDIDKQPLFGMPAMVGRTAWFVSYRGELRGIDLAGPVAKPLPRPFSVGTAEGGAPEWRPGGWQVIASDAKGLLYILMNPAGKEGSHKDGGTEVWVVDPATRKRVQRIDLGGVAVSIAITREETPHLVVARPSAAIDVFDAATGKSMHSLGATVAFNPLIIMPAQ